MNLVIEFDSYSILDTEKIVSDFYQNQLLHLKGAVLLLEGQLGSGKTKFCQILGKKMGVQEIINSPSFNLYNIYPFERGYFCHFDLYRITSNEELEETELREIWYDKYENKFTIHAIEWWEKAKYIESLLPKFLIKIRSNPDKDSYRNIKIFKI